MTRTILPVFLLLTAFLTVDIALFNGTYSLAAKRELQAQGRTLGMEIRKMVKSAVPFS